MRDFFISYTKADKEWAAWIAWILEEQGYTVFIQAWDILIGENFVAKMQRAMMETRKTIALLSDDYPRSRYAEEEWTDALRREVLVVFKVKQCQPAGIFATRVYADLVGISETDARAEVLGAFSGSARTESVKSELPKEERRKPDSAPPFPGDASAASRVSLSDNIDAVINQSDADKSPFSPAEQHKLFCNLLTLPISQLNVMIHSLAPPPDAIRPMPATNEERVSDLLRWAKGTSGPGLRGLQSVFELMLKPSDQILKGPMNADRGVDVVKTCDRRKQEERFNTCFKLCNDRRRGYAQFFITHGRDLEGHTSLVERFCSTTLRHRSGEGKLTPWEPGWPQTGNLKVDEERLVSLLFEMAGREDPAGTLSERIRAFREVATSLAPVVVVMHTIEAEEWLRSTRKLIRRYAKFWDELKHTDSNGTFPLFVVFLNIVYPLLQDSSGAPLRGWRLLRQKLMIGRVKLALLWLSRMRGRSPLKFPSRQSSSITLLKELSCVGVGDIREWLRVHRYGEYEWQRLEHGHRIFKSHQWEVFDCKNMTDVEKALSQFVAEMTPTKRAYL